MSIRPRSLVSNSIGSILSSGMLIFSTILIPAILARELTRAQFNAYSVALATLPLMLILPQSMRTIGATQLALAVSTYGEERALGGYQRFVRMVSFAHAFLVAIGIEIYVAVGHPFTAGIIQLRFELYCILVYTLGLFATGLVVAPASAHRDFRPDNIAKFTPGMLQLAGVTLIWLLNLDESLVWIFIVYGVSSWGVASFLFLTRGSRLRQASRLKPPKPFVADLFLGLRGVLWWNFTAYLATAAAGLMVAIAFPASIAPFSIATSLLGIVSAALVAISGPIAVHATASREKPQFTRRRFFLLSNTLFQGYIAATALVIVVAPVELFALWLTPQLATEVKTFSLLLLPATVIRLLTMNFTIFVMSVGRQHTLWMSPMVEAMMSIFGSIAFGNLLGISGIPLALTLSAAVRLILTIVHDERINRRDLALFPGDMLLSGLRLIRERTC